MRSLSPEEIDEVNEILKERHPVYYSNPSIYDIFPILKTFAFWRKDDSAEKEVKSSDRILPEKIERSDGANSTNLLRYSSVQHARMELAESKKTLNLLGYGTIAYLEIQKYLIYAFIIMMILALPSYYLFLNYQGGRKSGSSILNLFSVGNLGFSSAVCKDTSLRVGNLTMDWPTGTMTNVISFGIIPSDGVINDAWFPNSETKLWEDSFDQASSKADIERLWLNRTYCTIDGSKYLKPSGNQKWISPYAQFYIQVFWLHTEEELDTRNSINIVFWVQTILTSLAFLYMLHILNKKNNENFKIWDKISSTISNYTVCYNIPEEVFQNFKNNIYQENQIEERKSQVIKSYIKPKTGRDLETPIDSKLLGVCSKDLRGFESWEESDNKSIYSDISDDNSLMFAFKKYLKKEFEILIQTYNSQRNSNWDRIEIVNINLNHWTV